MEHSPVEQFTGLHADEHSSSQKQQHGHGQHGGGPAHSHQVHSAWHDDHVPHVNHEQDVQRVYGY